MTDKHYWCEAYRSNVRKSNFDECIKAEFHTYEEAKKYREEINFVDDSDYGIFVWDDGKLYAVDDSGRCLRD